MSWKAGAFIEQVLHNTVGFQIQNHYGRRKVLSGENLVVHLLFVKKSILASSVTEVSWRVTPIWQRGKENKMGCSLSMGSRLMGTLEPPPSCRPWWTIKLKYPDGYTIQGCFNGNNHRGQDAGLGEGDSLIYRKNKRFAWQEDKENYTLRPETHNILIRKSLSAFDSTLCGSS